MTGLLIPRQELAFLLFDWLGVDRGPVDRVTIEAVLDLSEQLAEDMFLPHGRESDVVEPRLESDGVHILPAARDALREYAALGLFGLSFPDDLGGAGLPQSVAAASYSFFAAANISTGAYATLTVANARLLLSFGTQAQIEQFALPQIQGRWFGTMCLSEPQAGSSLGDITTRAVAEGQDELGARYRLFGKKMWISGGDQNESENIVHLVLAKAQREDRSLPIGTEGISLFIVPKYQPDGRPNDVVVTGLNHKLGYRGTANCLLNFGEQEGALGWRVGQEGQGLRQMFHMMNEARIFVGLGAAALAVRGYRHSARYALERLQGRPKGQRGGDPVPIVSHVDVRRMLLQQKAYAEGALALCLFSAHLFDDATPEAQSLLELLTPVTKSWPSEFGLIANDIAIQIHGGYGYTRDFAVEQLWRDNRLNAIHEGTTGIQAIDLLNRKILRSDGSAMKIADGRIRSAVASLPADLRPYSMALLGAWDGILTTVEQLRSSEDPLRDATLFLRAFGHVVVAWLWLDQVRIAATLPDTTFGGSKLRTCRFFFETELSQVSTWLGIVRLESDVAAGAPAEMFI